MIRTFNRLTFLVLIAVLAVSFLARRSYRGVDNIHPAVIKQPIQNEVESEEVISFTKDDYEYELTPLFDYEINGLVVHIFDYSWWGIYETGSLFPVDLCMIWGGNVESGVYRNKALSFGQDYRWCWYRWESELEFDSNEAANNHLLIVDEDLRRRAKSLVAGDQVRIVGSLVNVLGKYVGDDVGERAEQIVWKTSTTREDAGVGGCEVIYVEELAVLKRGHPVAGLLFRASLLGLGVWLGVNVLLFVKEVLFH